MILHWRLVGHGRGPSCPLGNDREAAWAGRGGGGGDRAGKGLGMPRAGPGGDVRGDSEGLRRGRAAHRWASSCRPQALINEGFTPKSFSDCKLLQVTAKNCKLLRIAF
jgi:hypothetical protein